MKPPCELAVKEFLPSLRAAIVRELSEEYHMKQIDIAEVLGITQASVSQYLNDERAKENRFTVIKGFTQAVKKIAGTIALQNVSKAAVLHLMCEVCSQVRSSEEFCHVHQDMLMDGECNICRQ